MPTNFDPVTTTIALGGSFVARGFSGDRAQLVPLIKAAIRREGCAVLDVISPCVTFNDHEGSTKSYAYTRRNYHPSVYTDFVPPAEPIEAEQKEGKVVSVTLHGRAEDPPLIREILDHVQGREALRDHAPRARRVTG